VGWSYVSLQVMVDSNFPCSDSLCLSCIYCAAIKGGQWTTVRAQKGSLRGTFFPPCCPLIGTQKKPTTSEQTNECVSAKQPGVFWNNTLPRSYYYRASGKGRGMIRGWPSLQLLAAPCTGGWTAGRCPTDALIGQVHNSHGRCTLNGHGAGRTCVQWMVGTHVRMYSQTNKQAQLLAWILVDSRQTC
jgi:hypothetical protein